MSTTTTPVTGAIAEGTGTGALADDIAVDGRTYHLEIFLISMAGLLLEIAYTRVISFKLFYYYTYLIIGLALLGVGFGGVLVAVSERLRRLRTDTILLWGSLIGVASVAVGYLVVAITHINTLRCGTTAPGCPSAASSGCCSSASRSSRRSPPSV